MNELVIKTVAEMVYLFNVAIAINDSVMARASNFRTSYWEFKPNPRYSENPLLTQSYIVNNNAYNIFYKKEKMNLTVYFFF